MIDIIIVGFACISLIVAATTLEKKPNCDKKVCDERQEENEK